MTAVTRVLVTVGGHEFVTAMPLPLAARSYPWRHGYELRVVRGHVTPGGFVVATADMDTAVAS